MSLPSRIQVNKEDMVRAGAGATTPRKEVAMQRSEVAMQRSKEEERRWMEEAAETGVDSHLREEGGMVEVSPGRHRRQIRRGRRRQRRIRRGRRRQRRIRRYHLQRRMRRPEVAHVEPEMARVEAPQHRPTLAVEVSHAHRPVGKRTLMTLVLPYPAPQHQDSVQRVFCMG